MASPTCGGTDSTTACSSGTPQDTYGTHDAVKVALKKIPREKVTIVTKSESRSGEQMKADLDRYRQEMGTDYIDIVLLHSVVAPQWDQALKPQMDVLAEAKEKKLIPRWASVAIRSGP